MAHTVETNLLPPHDNLLLPVGVMTQPNFCGGMRVVGDVHNTTADALFLTPMRCWGVASSSQSVLGLEKEFYFRESWRGCGAMVSENHAGSQSRSKLPMGRVGYARSHAKAASCMPYHKELPKGCSSDNMPNRCTYENKSQRPTRFVKAVILRKRSPSSNISTLSSA